MININFILHNIENNNFRVPGPLFFFHLIHITLHGRPVRLNFDRAYSISKRLRMSQLHYIIHLYIYIPTRNNNNLFLENYRIHFYTYLDFAIAIGSQSNCQYPSLYVCARKTIYVHVYNVHGNL